MDLLRLHWAKPKLGQAHTSPMPTCVHVYVDKHMHKINAIPLTFPDLANIAKNTHTHWWLSSDRDQWKVIEWVCQSTDIHSVHGQEGLAGPEGWRNKERGREVAHIQICEIYHTTHKNRVFKTFLYRAGQNGGATLHLVEYKTWEGSQKLLKTSTCHIDGQNLFFHLLYLKKRGKTFKRKNVKWAVFI